MASKALSKEIRHVISQKTGAVRKRMSEASTIERVTTSGVAPVGASIAGILDAYDVKIPIGRVRIPLSPIGAVIGIGAGLALGKGMLGAGVLGFGIGQLDGLFYSLGHSIVESMRDGGGADDDDES